MILLQSSTALGNTSTQDTMIANHKYTQTIWCIFNPHLQLKKHIAEIQSRDPDHDQDNQIKTDALDRSTMI